MILCCCLSGTATEGREKQRFLTDSRNDGGDEEQRSVELPLDAGFVRDRPDDVVAYHVEHFVADVVLGPQIQLLRFQLGPLRLLEGRLEGVEHRSSDEQVGQRGSDQKESSGVLLLHRRRLQALRRHNWTVSPTTTDLVTLLSVGNFRFYMCCRLSWRFFDARHYRALYRITSASAECGSRVQNHITQSKN